MIRHECEEDCTTMNVWEDARDYCVSKGLKLTTWAQSCPDGKGNGSRPCKSPVGGMIDGQHWVAVADDVEPWVDVGRNPSYCVGDGCRSCRGHVDAHKSDVIVTKKTTCQQSSVLSR